MAPAIARYTVSVSQVAWRVASSEAVRQSPGSCGPHHQTLTHWSDRAASLSTIQYFKLQAKQIRKQPSVFLKLIPVGRMMFGVSNKFSLSYREPKPPIILLNLNNRPGRPSPAYL